MNKRRNVLVIVASAFALTPLVIFAWTGPTASPPNGNVAAPINVGTVAQVKNGNIGVNGLAVFGNSLFGGSTGSNAYLNFGATAGTNGYGIRDNAGLLEFKNSGGSWESLQATVFNLVGGTGSWTTSGNNIYNNNTGNVGIGTASPSWRLTVIGPAADWAQVVNWPSGSVNGYGILVGTGAGKYSQFQNAEGYYTLLAYSSWGLYTNGNIYTAGSISTGGNVIVGSATLATNGDLYMPWKGQWLSTALGNKIDCNTWGPGVSTSAPMEISIWCGEASGFQQY